MDRSRIRGKNMVILNKEKYGLTSTLVEITKKKYTQCYTMPLPMLLSFDSPVASFQLFKSGQISSPCTRFSQLQASTGSISVVLKPTTSPPEDRSKAATQSAHSNYG